VRLALTVVCFVAAACRHAPPSPTPTPPPSEAEQLAAALDDDLARLGEIAHRLRGHCPALIAELRPHVARMKQHHDRVQHLLADPKQASELKQALAAYNTRAGGKAEAIADDLGATYRTCHDCATDLACKQRYQLERVIADMPTY